MQNISYPAPFSSFLNEGEDYETTTINYPSLRKTASNSIRSSKARQNPGATTVRPVTPSSHRASEAHIHRIRTASSRADFHEHLALAPVPVQVILNSETYGQNLGSLRHL